MQQTATVSADPKQVQRHYRDDFARHVMGVALYLQAEIMTRLTREYGHAQLRINFEPYINIVGSRGARELGELLLTGEFSER